MFAWNTFSRLDFPLLRIRVKITLVTGEVNVRKCENLLLFFHFKLNILDKRTEKETKMVIAHYFLTS